MPWISAWNFWMGAIVSLHTCRSRRAGTSRLAVGQVPGEADATTGAPAAAGVLLALLFELHAATKASRIMETAIAVLRNIELTSPHTLAQICTHPPAFAAFS